MLIGVLIELYLPFLVLNVNVCISIEMKCSTCSYPDNDFVICVCVMCELAFDEL